MTFTPPPCLGRIRPLWIPPRRSFPQTRADSGTRGQPPGQDDQPQQGVLRVRLSFQSAVLAALLVTLCGLSATAFGQSAPGAARPAAAAPAPTGTNVAVIDIALIFKYHDRFNGQMNDIKRDIEQFEAYVKDQQKALKAKADELPNYNASSPEYKSREADIAKTQSELQVKIGLQRKEFLEREARVYYQIYKEIEKSVATFAQRARIGLVLRFNSD